jgi:predicted nucleic-acid-binding Zn-ribbon protein
MPVDRAHWEHLINWLTSKRVDRDPARCPSCGTSNGWDNWEVDAVMLWRLDTDDGVARRAGNSNWCFQVICTTCGYAEFYDTLRVGLDLSYATDDQPDDPAL